jgi:hypothetical protein
MFVVELIIYLKNEHHVYTCLRFPNQVERLKKFCIAKQHTANYTFVAFLFKQAHIGESTLPVHFPLKLKLITKHCICNSRTHKCEFLSLEIYLFSTYKKFYCLLLMFHSICRRFEFNKIKLLVRESKTRNVFTCFPNSSFQPCHHFNCQWQAKNLKRL